MIPLTGRAGLRRPRALADWPAKSKDVRVWRNGDSLQDLEFPEDGDLDATVHRPRKNVNHSKARDTRHEYVLHWIGPPPPVELQAALNSFFYGTFLPPPRKMDGDLSPYLLTKALGPSVFFSACVYRIIVGHYFVIPKTQKVHFGGSAKYQGRALGEGVGWKRTTYFLV